MESYRQEQLDALRQIRAGMASLSQEQRRKLGDGIEHYLAFRRELDLFSKKWLGPHCTIGCFQNRLSACCSREGIITFWADAVINAANSTENQMDDWAQALLNPYNPDKCTYLGPRGCRWQVRPLGCAVFLCDTVQESVLGPEPALMRQWGIFQQRAREFRWPDRPEPVLFDRLESFFMTRGCRSSLMYLHTSPGLLRIKKNQAASNSENS